MRYWCHRSPATCGDASTTLSGSSTRTPHCHYSSAAPSCTISSRQSTRSLTAMDASADFSPPSTLSSRGYCLVQQGVLPQPLLYLSSYFEAHRQEYYDRLQAVRERGRFQE
jgi:hypothetical protein